MPRFFLGLLLGLCLASYAFALEGVGHGTDAPMAFGGSLLAFIGDLGPLIPSLGIPIVWSLYFLLIPDIESTRKKIGVLIAVLSLHLLTGLWFSIDDKLGMKRAYALERGSLILFFVFFLVSMLLLVFVTLKRHRTSPGVS